MSNPSVEEASSNNPRFNQREGNEERPRGNTITSRARKTRVGRPKDSSQAGRLLRGLSNKDLKKAELQKSHTDVRVANGSPRLTELETKRQTRSKSIDSALELHTNSSRHTPHPPRERRRQALYPTRTSEGDPVSCTNYLVTLIMCFNSLPNIAM